MMKSALMFIAETFAFATFILVMCAAVVIFGGL
jgi:hypothetical protein